MLRFYNSISREKEELKPIHKEWVGLYTCGPTVYNFAHIGNLRTYIFEDILQRTLEYNGYIVRRVMNITDVGHLTGDTDAGDDKLEKAAQSERRSVQEIAQFYTKAFLGDLEKLNIERPEKLAPATKLINEQVALIQSLFQRGFAYDTPTAVYFDVSKFKDYGKLSGQSLQEKAVGAREEVVTDKEKRHPQDFALWFKLEGKFKKHILHWPSPWGEGFPGWHIECSAISRAFLGQPFDIHTGGVDHIGTHHTNEIAQSEAAYGVPLAHIWMHGEFLVLNDAKMAKSEGNFLTLTELEKEGYDPLVFRHFVLGAHYRTKLNFSWDAMAASRNAIERIYQTIYALAAEKKSLVRDGSEEILKKLDAQFLETMNDDLNTPKALAVLHEALGDHGNPWGQIELVKKFDRILGLRLDTPVMAHLKDEKTQIAEKMMKYQELRANKQFVQSDALRKEIEALGYSVRDLAPTKGTTVALVFFKHGLDQKSTTEDPAAES